LPADLVQNEYQCGFAVFCALIREHERCDGHIVVEWAREGMFLWRGLFVWVARKVLRGEGEVPNLRRLEVTISKELGD